MRIARAIRRVGGLAYPQYIGATHDNSSQGTGTITIDCPSGAQVGDLAILLASASILDGGMSAPSGWLTGYSYDGDGDNDDNAHFFYRVLGSIGQISLEFSDGEGCSAILVVFRNAEVLDQGMDTGSQSMPDPDELSGFQPGNVAVAVGHLYDDAVTATAPSGYTLAATYTSFSYPFSSTTMCAYKTFPSETENPAAFGGSSSADWASAMIRLGHKLNG